MATDKKGLKIYLEQELADRLSAQARHEDRTVTAIVTRLIREYLATYDNNNDNDERIAA